MGISTENWLKKGWFGDVIEKRINWRIGIISGVVLVLCLVWTRLRVLYVNMLVVAIEEYQYEYDARLGDRDASKLIDAVILGSSD